MVRSTRLSISLGVLLLGLLALPASSLAQGTATYFISNVDPSQFPDIHFDLRALDLNNATIPNLNGANLAVYENGQLVPSVEVTPHTDGPVHYVFVVDLGRQSNYNFFGLANMRAAITTVVDGGYFVNGVDTVEVWGRQNINSDQTLNLLAPTQSGADLTNWAANFNFARSVGPTKGLLGVEDTLAHLAEEPPLPSERTTAIIFITRFIEEPKASVAVSAAESLAQKAKGGYVPVYTFQTDAGGSGHDVLQNLANGSNALYVALPRTSVVTAVSDVYRTIHGQRTWYTVAYRSLLGHSGTRLITINSADAPAAGQAGRYDVTVGLPTVEISEPNPGSTIRREPVLGADGATWIYGNTTVPVTATITWPAGVAPRRIKSAELLVDGVLQDTAAPAGDDAQITFDWDISDIVAAGLNTAQLEVRVTDELSLEAPGQATILVEVVPPPTPVPEDPAKARLAGLVAATRPYWIVVPLALIGLVLAVAFSGVVWYLTRPVQARAKVISDIRNTLIGGGPRAKTRVLATLRVIDGPKAWVGETINISKEKTTMGRNPEAVDIPFYRDEESTVSRVHATLQLDRASFIITDHGSTSGTRVNGEWLKPNDPVQLRDGDEIVLGDLTQRGVKLRFSYLLDKTELPAAQAARGAAASAQSNPTGNPQSNPSNPSGALDRPSKPPEKTMYDGFKWDEDKWNEDK